MDMFKAFGWADADNNEGMTRVGGVTNVADLRAEIAGLRREIERLINDRVVMEQDRIADACHIDRMAIQIQILRGDAAVMRARIEQLEAHTC